MSHFLQIASIIGADDAYRLIDNYADKRFYIHPNNARLIQLIGKEKLEKLSQEFGFVQVRFNKQEIGFIEKKEELCYNLLNSKATPEQIAQRLKCSTRTAYRVISKVKSIYGL